MLNPDHKKKGCILLLLDITRFLTCMCDEMCWSIGQKYSHLPVFLDNLKILEFSKNNDFNFSKNSI